MTTILLDPTLRRARIVRATVAALLFAAVAAIAFCAFALRVRERPGPTLPSPRRGGKSAGRRPYFGQARPAAGQTRRTRRRSSEASHTVERVIDHRAPRVTAFIDPTVTGAIASLRACLADRWGGVHRSTRR